MNSFERIVRQWFDAVHARDWPAVAAMYSPTCEYIRTDGTSFGPDQVVSYLEALLDAFPDHASRIDAALISDQGVTVEWTESGTHTEPYRGGMLGEIAATNKAFEGKIVEIFRFTDLQIQSQHEYYDLFGLLSQLGWLEKLIPAANVETTSTA